MDFQHRLFKLCGPVLNESGYELVWVEVVQAGRSRKAMFFIDKLRQGGEGAVPGDGINVGDCAAASRIIEHVVEKSDLFGHSYVLEVSSTGLDRPLFKEDDYLRFTGRKARIRLSRPLEGRKKFSGVLRGVNEKGEVLLELDGGEQASIPIESIRRANLVFEWEKKKK
ncbi:MAG: ribosome maturation factor RimP [Gemmatimonadota bacterium]|nr:ribosome maturation factor RimP [Gemmatimonadota bacterium]